MRDLQEAISSAISLEDELQKHIDSMTRKLIHVQMTRRTMERMQNAMGLDNPQQTIYNDRVLREGVN